MNVGIFQKFDVSGRLPRDVQLTVLKWLNDNWHKADVFGIRADTGSGKSAIGRTVIEPNGGHYITPSNVLLDQVAQTYKDVPAVKGYQNYQCKNIKELDCLGAKTLSGRYCATCPAAEIRQRALEEPCSIFNPISYKVLKGNKDFKEPNVIVVDEAHALPRMALLFAETKLLCKDYLMPRFTSAIDIKEWAENRISELRKTGEYLFRHKKYKEANKTANKIRKLSRISEFIKDGSNYHWYYQHEQWRSKRELFFYMRPIDPPIEFMSDLLTAKKVVLMSATLFKSDIDKILPGRRYLYLDLPSPIPKERRPVIYKPIGKVNASTDPETIANWIKEQLKLYPGNAIIHVSYSWAAKLQPFSFYTVANFKPEEKSKAIEKFRNEGGVFMAAGCSEGIDLPYDLCRVNIIPILQKENIGDVIVKKRLLRPDGNRNYDIEVIRTTIQQTGRSTRSEDDYSTTVIGDQAFLILMQRYKDIVPQSYREAIRW